MIRSIRLAAIAGMLISLPMAFTGAANAAPGTGSRAATYGLFINHTNANYVNIRPCPYTTGSCNPVGQAQKSHALEDYCYTEGTLFEGTVWWDYVYDQATGKAGYITEARLVNKSQQTRC
jgi:hypothetical protein